LNLLSAVAPPGQRGLRLLDDRQLRQCHRSHHCGEAGDHLHGISGEVKETFFMAFQVWNLPIFSYFVCIILSCLVLSCFEMMKLKIDNLICILQFNDEIKS
jgi:hypothetical protein